MKIYKIYVICFLLLIIGLFFANCQKNNNELQEDPIVKMLAERGYSVYKTPGSTDRIGILNEETWEYEYITLKRDEGNIGPIGKIVPDDTLNYQYFTFVNNGQEIEIHAKEEAEIIFLKTWFENEEYQFILDHDKSTKYMPGKIEKVSAEKFSVLLYFDRLYDVGYTWPSLGIVPTENGVEIYRISPLI